MAAAAALHASICRSLPVLLLLFLLSQASASWLMAAQLASALSSPDYYNCQMQPGLTRRQREVCVRHPATMRAISDGLRDAIDACHAQFERDRWNCSATFGMGAPARGVATAETAFIFAISSGGASHAVARACSRGAIPECGCGGGEHTVVGGGESKAGMPSGQVMGPPDGISADPQQFIWAGCSDNVRYGNQFTRKFIDAAEKQRTDARSLMNLHNNRVGRKLLAANMRKQCKCHGVSGSCVTKTCWRTVPKMEELAGILKRKYARAQQVTMASDSAALVLPSPSPATAAPYSMAQAASSRSGRFLKDRVRFEPAQLANRAELVYLEASPDYCDMDASGERMSGTSGRECFSQQECEQLCCGRGWDTRREVRQEPCRCKFVWCCDVKCDTCRREVERRFCR